MGLFSPAMDSMAKNGDVKGVRKALLRGTDANRVSKSLGKHHRRPLHIAAHAGQLEIVETLLQHGAFLNSQDDFGQTPLHYVARTNYVEVADALLRSGADHTVRDKYGNLPIHVANAAGQRAMQERLWQHAVDNPLEVRYFEGGTWNAYDESAARAVSFELGEGSAYCALVTSAGATYIVDFRQQLQINASSMFAKSICWRVPPLGAWNYPAKPFQGLHPGSQEPRYLAMYAPLLQELRSQGLAPSPSVSQRSTSWSARENSPSYPPPLPQSNSMPGRSASVTPLPSLTPLPRSYSLESCPSPRESLLDPHRSSASASASASSSNSVPSAPPVDESKPHFLAARPPMFKALRSGSPQYNEVVGRFINGMTKKQTRVSVGSSVDSIVNSPSPLRPVTVTCVYEVRAPEGRRDAFEGALSDRRAARGNANERLAWHGAPFENLENIVLNGFKLSPGGRNGRLYGQGIYFAPEQRAYTSAEFAVPDSSGEKHMLLCRLIVGAMEVVPFESLQRRPSDDRFDTGTDNMEEPTRYIVWEDDVNEHVLPTHIVSFKYC